MFKRCFGEKYRTILLLLKFYLSYTFNPYISFWFNSFKNAEQCNRNSNKFSTSLGGEKRPWLQTWILSLKLNKNSIWYRTMTNYIIPYNATITSDLQLTNLHPTSGWMEFLRNDWNPIAIWRRWMDWMDGWMIGWLGGRFPAIECSYICCLFVSHSRPLCHTTPQPTGGPSVAFFHLGYVMPWRDRVTMRVISTRRRSKCAIRRWQRTLPLFFCLFSLHFLSFFISSFLILYKKHL